MKSYTAILCVSLSLLAGCSDENKEARGEFLAGCVSSGTPKSICSCTFEKLEQKYSPEELRRIMLSGALPPQSLLQNVAESALTCRSE